MSGTCCGKESSPWLTRPVANLALKVAGGWKSRCAYVGHSLPSTHGYVVRQSLVVLTCTWTVNLLRHLPGFPDEKVWCRIGLMWQSDSPCIVYTSCDCGDQVFSGGVVHRMSAWEYVCHPYQWRAVTSSQAGLLLIYHSVLRTMYGLWLLSQLFVAASKRSRIYSRDFISACTTTYATAKPLWQQETSHVINVQWKRPINHLVT